MDHPRPIPPDLGPDGRERFRAPEHDRARRLMERHVERELRVKRAIFRRSVSAAIALFLLKAGAAWATNSLAVLASGLDSLLDAAFSGLNWFSTMKAEKPADPEHPFGHGKVESLVGGLQALLLGGVAVGIGIQGVRRMLDPQPVNDSGWGIAAMVVSAVVALALSRSIRARSRESESPIIATEQLHYSLDFTTHAGVILALVLQQATGVVYFDPFVSLLIAAFVIWQVRTLVVESVRDLLDQELPSETRREIHRILEEHSNQLLTYHGLRTRRAGTQKIVSLHLVLCKEISFETSHHIVDHIEEELSRRISRVDVTIHADPCGEYCPGEDRCPWARLLRR